MLRSLRKMVMPSVDTAPAGRTATLAVTNRHAVNGTPILPPFSADMEQAVFGLGCFWGAERKFWQQPGVWTTAVGYTAGDTPNPTYDEVCSGMTGHGEVVLVVFDPQAISYADLLRVFWENHDPTQGMRQRNDVGTQYRSGIYTHGDAQQAASIASRDLYAKEIARAGYGAITTEIIPAPAFYYAEDYHQQYLAKKPWGYCALAGTGVSCPIGLEGVVTS